MITTSELRGFVRSLFPGAGKELLHFYDAAVDKGGLLYTELCTIHDLLNLSCYADQEPVHTVLILMLAALDEGSVCIDTAELALAGRLRNILHEEGAKDWAQRIRAGLQGQGYPDLIGSEGVSDRPIIRCRRASGDLLYFQKLLSCETAFSGALRQRIVLAREKSVSPAMRAAAIQEMLVLQSSPHKGNHVQLKGNQQIALALALLQNFVVLSGGPGTGKTSIVFVLLRCLLRNGIKAESIALAAPTGLAAQRLTEAVRKGFIALPNEAQASGPDAALKNVAAQTLHRLLQYQPSRGTFRHHANNPLPFDVVIVDEISMVGLVLMAQLFQAVKPEAKLILLGDKDQLPSVEAGAILGHLTPSDGQPCYSEAMGLRLKEMLPNHNLPFNCREHWLRDSLVILDENFRSQKQIQEVAHAINAQDETILERMPRCKLPSEANPTNEPGQIPSLTFTELNARGGCWHMEMTTKSLSDWRRCLRRWAEHSFLTNRHDGSSYADLTRKCPALRPDPSSEQRDFLNRIFVLLGQVRILTLIREGLWGCDGINAFVSNRLKPRFGQPQGGRLFAGAPVLITRNDYVRELFNGDVGVALHAAGGGYCVVFKRPDGFLMIPEEALPAHELAFALTVHKSQGSEYGQVMLVVPPEGGRRLLTKEVIYTGITRARDLAILVGSKEALRASIRRKMERTSGLTHFTI